MAFIGFRLSDDLAARFDAVAARKGGRSRFLRTLVEQTADVASERALDPQPARSSTKLTLRLREDDLVSLDRLSGEAGMQRTEWAVACLRRRLLRRPQFNREQADALLAARRELRRISDQVREVLREVRGGDLPLAELEPRLATLEMLQREVRVQLEEVRRALEGEASYWEESDV